MLPGEQDKVGPAGSAAGTDSSRSCVIDGDAACEGGAGPDAALRSSESKADTGALGCIGDVGETEQPQPVCETTQRLLFASLAAEVLTQLSAGGARSDPSSHGDTLPSMAAGSARVSGVAGAVEETVTLTVLCSAGAGGKSGCVASNTTAASGPLAGLVEMV
jgi:hypothetical protein